VKVIVTNKKVWMIGIKKNSISIPEEETDMGKLSDSLQYLSSQDYTVASTPSNPGNGGGTNPGCGAGAGQIVYQFKLGPITVTLSSKFQYVPGKGLSCVP
jgi:hypothetical protein